MPKYWRETNFQPREFPRSGSKAIDLEEEKREKKRKIEQKLVIAMATSGGARKPSGPIYLSLFFQ